MRLLGQVSHVDIRHASTWQCALAKYLSNLYRINCIVAESQIHRNVRNDIMQNGELWM